MIPSSTHEAVELTVIGGPIRSVTIVVDPFLAGRIALDLRADDPSEVKAVVTRRKGIRLVVDVPTPNAQDKPRRGFLDRLLGRSRVIEGDLVANRSQSGNGKPPTLDISLRVPDGCAVRLDLSGGVEASVGDGIGNLALNLSGGVNATVGKVLAAKVEASGGVTATIAGTRGDLAVDLSGASKIVVVFAEGGNLSLNSSGSGVLKVLGGEIGNVKAVLSGAGVVVVKAKVAGHLDFDGTGAFEADFLRVLGRTKTRKTGSGTVRVSGRKQ